MFKNNDEYIFIPCFCSESSDGLLFSKTDLGVSIETNVYHNSDNNFINRLHNIFQKIWDMEINNCFYPYYLGNVLNIMSQFPIGFKPITRVKRYTEFETHWTIANTFQYKPTFVERLKVLLGKTVNKRLHIYYDYTDKKLSIQIL